MLVERSRLLRRFRGAVLLQHLSWSFAQRTGIFTSFWVKTCCSAHLTILPSLWTPSVSVPPQVYLYLRPSLSKPKNVHAISKPPPSLLRDCPPPHTVHLAFLLAPFFYIASFYFTPFCCRQLLLSTAPKFSLRSQPSVPVRGEKFFVFFFLTHTYFPLSCIFPLVHMHNSLLPTLRPYVAFLSVSCFSLSLSHFHRLYLFSVSFPLPSSLFCLRLSLLPNPACQALLHGC